MKNTLQRVREAVERRDFSYAEQILDSAGSATLGSIIARPPLKRQDRLAIKETRGVVGRVHEGMQFLELVAISFTGKNRESVLMFDKVKTFVNPSLFTMSNNIQDQLNLIYASLGVAEYVAMID